MELTAKQKEGLKIALQRYIDGSPYTVISGFAGTGKSTLVKFIIDALGASPEDVAYVTFTGKAAEVLRRKGCDNACTAHKLLYYSVKTIEGKFIFKPIARLENPYKIIIADEISMLPKELWERLLSHHIYVVACGDPFQIPPVYKDSDNHALDNPHIFLDEIMRQEEDSEIIKLSMDIRNYRPVKYSKGNDVHVVPKESLVTGMYTWADQIIVATNRMRSKVNAEVREMVGKAGTPQIGDKVISLENHWDILDNSGDAALINGTIGYIKDIHVESIEYAIGPRFKIGPIDVYKMTIETEIGEVFEDITVDKKYIDYGEKTLSPKQEYHIYKNKYKLKEDVPCLFDYGYAITCHRAQGSEWGKVLVLEEKFPYDKEEHARWLYTAVTRGSDKVVLVK